MSSSWNKENFGKRTQDKRENLFGNSGQTDQGGYSSMDTGTQNTTKNTQTFDDIPAFDDTQAVDDSPSAQVPSSQETGEQWVRRASESGSQSGQFRYAFTSGQLDHPED